MCISHFGIVVSGSPHLVNQNVQSIKPVQGTSLAVTSSSTRTLPVEKTGMPTAAASLAQPSESLLHEGRARGR